MAIINWPLLIDQFTDTSVLFTWTTGPTQIPVNLSGASARSMIRGSPTDPNPMVSVSTAPNASGSIVLGGAAGTILLTISKSVFPSLIVGTQQWDLLIDWPNGTTQKFATGSVLVPGTNTHN